MHEQVITLCAATHKVMLDVEVKKIKEFQNQMLAYFERVHPEIGQEIEEKQVLTDELEERIAAAALEFKSKSR